MPHPALAPTEYSAAELLALLRQHGGREYSAQLCPPRLAGRASKKSRPAPLSPTLPTYLLTWRGQQLHASGPSQQARWLSPAQFLELFSASRFGQVTPTGQLSDLGPLFEVTSP